MTDPAFPEGWFPPTPAPKGRRPLIDWHAHLQAWPDASPEALHLTAAIFGVTALLAFQAWLRMDKVGSSQGSHVTTGMRMRKNLVCALAVACLVRCLATIAEMHFPYGAGLFLVNMEHWRAAKRHWVRDICTMLPALLFLSCFSMVVLFFAQLHYTATMAGPVPLLRCLFITMNVACYILVAVGAVVTFFLQAYGHFLLCTLCIVGILNLTVALTFLFYGVSVVKELSETARKKVPGTKLTPRVVVLCVVCPVALILRGCFYLAWCLSFGDPTWTSDLVLCLLSEWLPAAFILLILSPLKAPGSLKTPLISVTDSTDSEEPLLFDKQETNRNTAGAIGATWKQLYPEPEK